MFQVQLQRDPPWQMLQRPIVPRYYLRDYAAAERPVPRAEHCTPWNPCNLCEINGPVVNMLEHVIEYTRFLNLATDEELGAQLTTREQVTDTLRTVEINYREFARRRFGVMDLTRIPRHSDLPDKIINGFFRAPENQPFIFIGHIFREIRRARRRNDAHANFRATWRLPEHNLTSYRDPETMFDGFNPEDDPVDPATMMQRLTSVNLDVDSVTLVPFEAEDVPVSFCYGHQTMAENLLADFEHIVQVCPDGFLYCRCPAFLDHDTATRCNAYHDFESITSQLNPDTCKQFENLTDGTPGQLKWRRSIFKYLPDATECPNPHCRHEEDDGIGYHMTKETARNWIRNGVFSGVNPLEDVRECLTCGTIWCNLCQERFLTVGGDDTVKHDHLTCEEYRQVRDKEIDPSELMVKKMAVTCPGCQTDIAITSGCNHITCTVCHGHFCYLCLNGCYDTYEEMTENHDRSKHQNRDGIPMKGTVDLMTEI